MMTQGVENLLLWRLLGAESELVCSIQDSCCRFVAGAAITYGNRCSDINLIQWFPNSRKCCSHIGEYYCD